MFFMVSTPLQKKRNPLKSRWDSRMDFVDSAPLLVFFVESILTKGIFFQGIKSAMLSSRSESQFLKSSLEQGTKQS